ncbi:MAG: nucleotidyltransferase family protein [Bacteroidota bacterium]
MNPVVQIIKQNEKMMSALALVKELGLPDCWIGAGFIRNSVWDYLHYKQSDHSVDDVDVIFFDAENTSIVYENQLELALRQINPSLKWSVKNQERMRVKYNLNYVSSIEAISYWPETATCIAARLNISDQLEIISPYGIDDLMNMIVKPSPNSSPEVFYKRLTEKKWQERWPMLRVEILEK